MITLIATTPPSTCCSTYVNLQTDIFLLYSLYFTTIHVYLTEVLLFGQIKINVKLEKVF